MKTLRLFLLSVLSIVIIHSCKDACKKITCQNGGACTDGKCACPAGYSGESCETKDPCYGITCQNGGTCASGTCNCPSGYSGTNCETANPNSKYIGSWSVDACNNAPDYTTTSIAGNNSSEFIIKKFHGDMQYDVRATVNANNFTITQQSMPTGMQIKGSGSINSNGTVMTITYDILDGSNIVEQSCSNVPYTKTN